MKAEHPPRITIIVQVDGDEAWRSWMRINPGWSRTQAIQHLTNQTNVLKNNLWNIILQKSVEHTTGDKP